jgi:hypothetical protein
MTPENKSMINNKDGRESWYLIFLYCLMISPNLGRSAWHALLVSFSILAWIVVAHMDGSSCLDGILLSVLQSSPAVFL